MLVLVADRHDLFRQGLVTLLYELNSADLDIQETSNLSGLTKLLEQATYDLVIIGMNILNNDNHSTLHTLREQYQETPLLVLIETSTPRIVDELRRYNLNGIIAKSASKASYLSALRSLLLGGNHIPLPISKRRPSSSLSGKGLFPGTLTRRQEEVLYLLADGKSNKEIAHYLRLSEGTVKVHVTAIFKALGVKNRTQAMLLAQQHRDDNLSS